MCQDRPRPPAFPATASVAGGAGLFSLQHCTLHQTLHTPHCTLHTPHCTAHSTLHTPQSRVRVQCDSRWRSLLSYSAVTSGGGGCTPPPTPPGTQHNTHHSHHSTRTQNERERETFLELRTFASCPKVNWILNHWILITDKLSMPKITKVL